MNNFCTLTPSKVLSFDNKNKKNCFLFCIVLTYSYLCKSNDGYSNNKYYFKI